MVRGFTFFIFLTILAVAAVHSSTLERNSPETSDNSAEAVKMSNSVESKLEKSILSGESEAEVGEAADDKELVREARHGGRGFHGGYHGGHYGGYSRWGSRPGYGYGYGMGGWRGGYGGRLGMGYGYGYGAYPYANTYATANTYCVLYPQMCYGYY